MIKYNPEWRKQGNVFTLHDGDVIGIVRLPDNSYEIVSVEGQIILSGIADEIVKAKTIVENRMGYHFFLEEDCEMDVGCKCGSCTHYTGKWQVYNRQDTIDMLFDSEAAAIEWIEKSELGNHET